MKKFEEKYPYVWLLLGLVLMFLSYGIFNTGICAWVFAIPLLRYINIRTKWSSILFMLIGTIIVANFAFWRLVEDNPNIMNQLFCTFNGIRMWAPFFVYFLCRYFGARKFIAYMAYPCAVAISEFFIDNPFVSIMTSLSISQFWNLGLMQFASITGVVGVSFIVTLLASIVNFGFEEGLKRKGLLAISIYSISLILIIGIGMSSVERITTVDKTVRIAAGVEDINTLYEEMDKVNTYQGSTIERIVNASLDVIETRAKDAVYNSASILVFPEDAFICIDTVAQDFIERTQEIAKEYNINILFPLLIMPDLGLEETDDIGNYILALRAGVVESDKKQTNTLNFIDKDGNLLYTYTKNHLVPIVEAPYSNSGDGKTPVIEIDGIKYTFLICADYTSRHLAYNGAEADIFLNPSFDWKAFQYFTSYGVQARAIECGFAVLRNPVNGNIILYDYHGRPMHMANVMDVHKGIMYLDVPQEGRTTFYELTGNWFPWSCLVYTLFAISSGFYLKRKDNE